MKEATRYHKGDKIGDRYLIQRALQGGMGEVYLCLDLETYHPYALKTFQQRFLTDLAMRNLFKQEVAHWIALERHPHIVRCFFMDTLANQPFMFLEWISNDESHGTDLRSRLRYRSLSLQLSLQFALDICSGLKHAQKKQPGIVHRDLKPENLLITQGDVAKITDWGLATLVMQAGFNLPTSKIFETDRRQNLMPVGDVMGTPPYMAPEQWRGEQLDVRTDLYAVGCILYEMITGSWPYKANSVAGFKQDHLFAPLPLLPEGAPSALVGIVECCLAKERSERYGSPEELSEALRAVYRAEFGEDARVLSTGVEFNVIDRNNRGLTYGSLGNYRQAIEDFDWVITHNPDFAAAYLNRGVIYAEQGQTALALADYDQAIARNSELFQAYTARGLALTILGQYELAIADHDHAILLNANNANAYHNRGIAYFEQGNPRRAIEEYNQAIALKPDLVSAFYNRGKAYTHLHQLERAIQDYNQAILLQPDYVRAYQNRGCCRADQGHWEQAIQDYNQAINLQPDFASAYFSRALAWEKLERWRQAIQDYDHAITFKPDWIDALYNRGNAYTSLGHLERAIEDYNQVVTLKPDLARAFYSRGTAYARLREYRQAMNDLDRAIDLQPGFASAYFNRGNAWAEQGRWEQAAQDYNQAIILQPEFANAYVNRGVALTKISQLEEAVACFEHAELLGAPMARNYADQTRQKLSRQVPSADPMQPAFEAFQLAGSMAEMRAAVVQFPLMIDADFIAVIEQAIATQVPIERHPTFLQRLNWLRQIALNQP